MDDSRVCVSASAVSPLSGKFTGPIFTAVPDFQFATSVSWWLRPLFAVCGFLLVVSPPRCCPYRLISIWTGVGEKTFTCESHVPIFGYGL